MCRNDVLIFWIDLKEKEGEMKKSFGLGLDPNCQVLSQFQSLLIEQCSWGEWTQLGLSKESNGQNLEDNN
ncbi:unnamed protein product [Paramecium sonneborni]|uniref:Uncharacterized protein n=1 Tax=Paramecium sonneborni TaxID=65129 RepID=A0A8S1MHD9_9CILI|nr:unnamed protein product [Paramecium sonneborni]